MTPVFILALVTSVPTASICGGVPQPADSSWSGADLETMYNGGRTYLEFRDAAERRVDAWHTHYAQAEISDATRTRAQVIPGTWRLLVIAEDWCGDSANTIPYIAKLTDVVPNIELRIINSEVGRSIMETHRTMDGRTATPTVILLNEEYAESGCWVERPSTLDAWFQANKDVLAEDDLYDQKYAWYAKDKGQETVKEILSIIESAARGETTCRAQTR